MPCHSTSSPEAPTISCLAPQVAQSYISSRIVTVWGTTRTISLTAWWREDLPGMSSGLTFYCCFPEWYKEQWELWLTGNLKPGDLKLIRRQMWRASGQWNHKRLWFPKKSKTNLTSHSGWGVGEWHQDSETKNTSVKPSPKQGNVNTSGMRNWGAVQLGQRLLRGKRAEGMGRRVCAS